MELEKEQVKEEKRQIRIEAFEWEAHLKNQRTPIEKLEKMRKEEPFHTPSSWEGQSMIRQYVNGYTEEMSFKNVLQAEKDGVLKRLFLQETGEGRFARRVFGVDLASGAFFFQGVWIFLPLSGKGFDYRVVYYRRKQADFALFGGDQKLAPVTVAYLLGWQATVDGRNVQRILFIYPDRNYVELREKR